MTKSHVFFACAAVILLAFVPHMAVAQGLPGPATGGLSRSEAAAPPSPGSLVERTPPQLRSLPAPSLPASPTAWRYRTIAAVVIPFPSWGTAIGAVGGGAYVGLVILGLDGSTEEFGQGLLLGAGVGALAGYAADFVIANILAERP